MNSEVGLRLFEVFTSLQGESSFAGLPFAFVRLSGCNLSCSWCDTPAAQLFESGHDVLVPEVIKKVLNTGMRYVCITGGEPLLQSGADDLMRRLLKIGLTVTVETNGSLDISNCPLGVRRIIDVKCPSSGMAERHCFDNFRLLRRGDEIKCVIADRVDYEYARGIIREHLSAFQGPVFLSPVLDRLEPRLLANWMISDRICARLQIQLHKIIGIA